MHANKINSPADYSPRYFSEIQFEFATFEIERVGKLSSTSKRMVRPPRENLFIYCFSLDVSLRSKLEIFSWLILFSPSFFFYHPNLLRVTSSPRWQVANSIETICTFSCEHDSSICCCFAVYFWSLRISLDSPTTVSPKTWKHARNTGRG